MQLDREDSRGNRFTTQYAKAATTHVALNSKSKSKKKTAKKANATAQQNRHLNEDSLMMHGIADVMSSSSHETNPDPDLHTEPQSSSRCSDVL